MALGTFCVKKSNDLIFGDHVILVVLALRRYSKYYEKHAINETWHHQALAITVE